MQLFHEYIYMYLSTSTNHLFFAEFQKISILELIETKKKKYYSKLDLKQFLHFSKACLKKLQFSSIDWGMWSCVLSVECGGKNPNFINHSCKGGTLISWIICKKKKKSEFCQSYIRKFRNFVSQLWKKLRISSITEKKKSWISSITDGEKIANCANWSQVLKKKKKTNFFNHMQKKNPQTHNFYWLVVEKKN